MKIFVTGGAGFIGSNLVDRLLQNGHVVTVYDNLSTGQSQFLEDVQRHPSFSFVEADLLDQVILQDVIAGHELVFHLSENADVRFGTEHPRLDLEQNIIATYKVLEAMLQNGVRKIAFSSTGSVYGEAEVIPTPEDAPFPIQTSLYDASKLACEGLISAYYEVFQLQSWIFRFVSILEERYTHGHVFDFYPKLQQDPTRLEVLDNGHQRKSYLYVQDCIDAMLLALDKAIERVNIINLGVNDSCEVNDSISWICEELGIKPKLEYTSGDRGQIGDNLLIHLDPSKMQGMGWMPKCLIQQGIIATVRYLQQIEWVFKRQEMRPWALITAASRGLGSELAHRFWESGYQLLLVSRNFESLEVIREKLHPTS